MGRSDRSGRDFAMAASCAKRAMTTGKSTERKTVDRSPPKANTLIFHWRPGRLFMTSCKEGAVPL